MHKKNCGNKVFPYKTQLIQVIYSVVFVPQTEFLMSTRKLKYQMRCEREGIKNTAKKIFSRTFSTFYMIFSVHTHTHSQFFL